VVDLILLSGRRKHAMIKNKNPAAASTTVMPENPKNASK
jgi:hypothetical protein